MKQPKKPKSPKFKIPVTRKVVMRPTVPPSPGAARRGDPWTSHAALPDSYQLRVEYLACLARTGHPLSTLEIGFLNGRDRDSYSPRSPELIEMGLVMKMGYRTIVNKSGNPHDFIAFGLTKWLTDPPPGFDPTPFLSAPPPETLEGEYIGAFE